MIELVGEERTEFMKLVGERVHDLGQILVRVIVGGRDMESISCPKCGSCAQDVMGWRKSACIIQQFMCHSCATVWQNEFEMLGVPVFRQTCIILGKTQNGLTR